MFLYGRLLYLQHYHVLLEFVRWRLLAVYTLLSALYLLQFP